MVDAYPGRQRASVMAPIVAAYILHTDIPCSTRASCPRSLRPWRLPLFHKLQAFVSLAFRTLEPQCVFTLALSQLRSTRFADICFRTVPHKLRGVLQMQSCRRFDSNHVPLHAQEIHNACLFYSYVDCALTFCFVLFCVCVCVCCLQRLQSIQM